jgi:IS5 family transposase
MRHDVTYVSAGFAKKLNMTLHFSANFVEDFMDKKHRIVRSGKPHAYRLVDQINLAHQLV